jgi:hypothetical protein
VAELKWLTALKLEKERMVLKVLKRGIHAIFSRKELLLAAGHPIPAAVEW